MSQERPEIQYSRDAENIKELKGDLTKTRQELSTLEGDIEAKKLELETLKAGQGDLYARFVRLSRDMTEADRENFIQEKIQILERTLEIMVANSKSLKESIGYIEVLMGVHGILEDEDRKYLERGEIPDEITGDIDSEGKPPRKVN